MRVLQMMLTSDLIETLWNVKLMEEEIEESLYNDLIETLWNVKYTAKSIYAALNTGFNRDIVECKVV